MKRVLFISLICLCQMRVWADAHGPAFGYSTTTLGAGDFSIETAFMWRSSTTMIGPKFSYGITENFQLSVSAPFHLNHGEHPVGRFMATMPGDPQVEGLLAWRFHHGLTGVGTRNESTLYAGLSATTQQVPRTDGLPLSREPGYYVAAATGHISRTYYVWAGGGYQYYGHWGSSADQQSSSLLTSLTFGWRPHFLNREYPSPDLRFFLETTGEWVGEARRDATTPPGPPHTHFVPALRPRPNSSDSVALPNSGGAGIFTGPSFLYTYRAVAFQGGIVFPAWSELNGTQPSETFRAVVGVSYLFLKGRK